MSALIQLSLITAFVLALAAGSPVYADKMDVETHTLLIDKLERVLELMDTKNEKRFDLMLRLADLHAERARLEDMDQGEKDADKNSKVALRDRSRALDLYKDSLNQAGLEAKGKIIFQMAQLYGLDGERSKAQDLYLKVAQNKEGKFPADVVGQALTHIGDNYFNKIQYDQAQKYFNKALEIKETPRRDYIKYRLAWCAFHEGKIKEATDSLTKVLKNPESQDLESIASFREEASRDLATFISRGKAGAQEVQTLADVSPEAVRRSNLLYLADELNRLGKKNAAVYVITVAGPEQSGDESDKDPAKDKIENHFKLAELQYDIGKKDQVVAELQGAMAQWKAEPCKVDENCVLLKDRFRKLMTAWGKAEEKHPSSQLVSAYAIYNSTFPEAEMSYWAALASRQNSMWKESAQFYRTASTLAQEQIKNGTAKAATGNSKLANILEGSLLGEIEVAEIAHDHGMREEAYVHYLQVRPDGQKKFEVMYQRAHILYEQGKYVDAANGFRTIAFMKGGPLSLREKAAHLSLDSLVLAKSEDPIQGWATEYAKEFNQSRASFLDIAKKAVINHIVQVINDPNANPNQLREALDRLATYPINESSKLERISFYKNKLILAERLQDLGDAKKAADGLLSIRGLPASDRQYALSRLEWINELTLNFKGAYSLAVGLPMSGMGPQERILKLAMLAELSGANPEKQYREFLRVSSDREKNQMVIAKIVRSQLTPSSLFQYESQLRSNPELLGTLALEIFAVRHDYSFIQNILKINGIWQTSSGKTLSRFVFLNNYHHLSEELMRSHGVHGKDIKKDLDYRLALLKRSEGAAAKALNSQDWVLQVIALSDIAYHYKRFALDMLSLPIPRGFTSDQRFQFQRMINEQAHTYQNKAFGVMKKVVDLWNDSSTINALFADYEKTRGQLRKGLYDELRIVAKVAPPSHRGDFVRTLAYSEARPSPQAIEMARASVSQNPFNTEKIEQLKILEEKAGKTTIVAFLDARLGQLQGGVKK